MSIWAVSCVALSSGSLLFIAWSSVAFKSSWRFDARKPSGICQLSTQCQMFDLESYQLLFGVRWLYHWNSAERWCPSTTCVWQNHQFHLTNEFFLEWHRFPWCSGYHIRLTRERSSVQNWAETRFLSKLLNTVSRKTMSFFLSSTSKQPAENYAYTWLVSIWGSYCVGLSPDSQSLQWPFAWPPLFELHVLSA